ncbi:MAG: HPP family protein, partial [Halobacteriaceae archaeon]
MLESIRSWYHTIINRVKRIERREIKEFRRWIESTSNLTHISVIIFVPLLIGLVTLLSNKIEQISFLLFPPLASGTYTLFADPEGRYASPVRFIGGMTLGAFSGWVSLIVASKYLYQIPPDQVVVHPGAAALGIFLTGIVTWAFNLELPTAFSTALLVLMTGTSRLVYVLGVMVSTTVIAIVFVTWRSEFYEQRAEYLYGTTNADDHVLIPMRGDTSETVATFGAKIAAAHEAGKVVLLDIVENEAVAAKERELIESGKTADREKAEQYAKANVAEPAASKLEQRAHTIESEMGIPCDVVVAVERSSPANTTLQTAKDTNCDLIVTPYEKDGESLSQFVKNLFRSNIDVIAMRSMTENNQWNRAMVPVRKAGTVAHAMIDYAERIIEEDGTLSICNCIDKEGKRREAELMLADLADPVSMECETRVARSSIEDFLEKNDDQYDIIFLGASTQRSTASRFISPPTFER